MAVISFVNPKGGTGKTTSCMLFSEAAVHLGYSVALIDCDPNLNIVSWSKTREEQGRRVPFAIHKCRSEDEIIEIVENLEEDFDLVCLDMEGTASQLVTYALSQSDMCIIPFEPTPMETRQAARAVQLLKRTSKMINREINYRLLFTRTNAAFQTHDEKDVRNSIADLLVMKTSIVRRAAYSRLFRNSDMLSELEGQNISNVPKAIKNAKAFALELIGYLAEAQK